MTKSVSTQPILSGLGEQPDMEPEIESLLGDATEEVVLDEQSTDDVVAESGEADIDFNALLEEATGSSSDSAPDLEDELSGETAESADVETQAAGESPESTSDAIFEEPGVAEARADAGVLDELQAKNDDELLTDSRPASEVEMAPAPKAKQTAAGVGFGVATAAGSLLKKITGTSVGAIEKRRRANILRAADRYENAVHNAVGTIERIGGSDWMKASLAVSDTNEGRAYMKEMAGRPENLELVNGLQRDLEVIQEAAKRLTETSLGAGYSLESIEDILEHGSNAVSGAVEENLPGLKDDKGESLADRIRKSLGGLMDWVRKLATLVPGVGAASGPAPGR